MFAGFNLWLSCYAHFGWSQYHSCLTNAKHWIIVVLIVFHRLRRWPTIKTTLGYHRTCLICSCHAMLMRVISISQPVCWSLAIVSSLCLIWHSDYLLRSHTSAYTFTHQRSHLHTLGSDFRQDCFHSDNSGWLRCGNIYNFVILRFRLILCSDLCFTLMIISLKEAIIIVSSEMTHNLLGKHMRRTTV